jgi:hypothetical protein
MSLGCFASACTSCPDSGRWTRAKRNAPSLLCTASVSSGSSLSFVIGPNVPAGFASFAAYGDLATGLLAILALLTVRIHPLFSLFVVTFNLVGAADIIIDYYHGIEVGLPALSGQLGATYAIPIIYVPILMITHVVAVYWLVRPRPKAARALAGHAVAS